jgi:hypothetical protein
VTDCSFPIFKASLFHNKKHLWFTINQGAGDDGSRQPVFIKAKHVTRAFILDRRGSLRLYANAMLLNKSYFQLNQFISRLQAHNLKFPSEPLDY